MKIFDPKTEVDFYLKSRVHPLVELTLGDGEGIMIFVSGEDKNRRMILRVKGDGRLHIEVNPEIIQDIVGYGFKGKIFDAEVTLDRPVY